MSFVTGVPTENLDRQRKRYFASPTIHKVIRRGKMLKPHEKALQEAIQKGGVLIMTTSWDSRRKSQRND